uniref:Uncharacterized protein n=1 Tax=Anguilla anguilla TaxID=7936 RepID=A0A0E9VIR9_ANGAN
MILVIIRIIDFSISSILMLVRFAKIYTRMKYKSRA